MFSALTFAANTLLAFFSYTHGLNGTVVARDVMFT